MKKLQVVYSKKEKAEKLLSNLEKLREEGAITEEQFQTLKSEYEKIREDTISEVEQIKSRMKDKLRNLEKQLETLKRDLSSFEARVKVGELSAESYVKTEQKTEAKIDKTEKRIASVETLINSKSSEETGGYIDVKIMEREGGRLVFPTVSDIFKFSAIKSKLTSLKFRPKFRTASLIGVIAIVVILVGALLLSLGKKSPSETVEIFFTALSEGSIAEVKEYGSLETLKAMKDAEGSLERAVKRSSREFKKKVEKFEILKENIRGEQATVRVRICNKNGTTEEDNIRLIKESGGWKVDLK